MTFCPKVHLERKFITPKQQTVIIMIASSQHMTTVVVVLLLLLFLCHDFFSTSGGISLVQGADKPSCTGGSWVVTKPEDEYIKEASSSVHIITNSHNEKYVLQMPNDLSDRRIWRTMIKLGAPKQKYDYNFLNCAVRHFAQLPLTW